MCGRFCMSLDPSTLTKACTWTTTSKIINNQQCEKTNSDDDHHNKVRSMHFRREFNMGRNYEPSFNICPGDLSPIIVSAKHFNVNANSSDKTLVPALWGMIPYWHKGNYKRHSLSGTHNARLESCLSLHNSYDRLIRRGKRCVVPIEGYYEWQNVSEDKKVLNSVKPVYFFHCPQIDGVKIEDNSTWRENPFPRLMYIAGVFDIWKDERKNSIYSFSTITFASDSELKWIHDRTPAVLESEEQIEKWINYEDYGTDVAMTMIKHPKNLSYHQVTNYVNDGRNNSEKCNKPMFP